MITKSLNILPHIALIHCHTLLTQASNMLVKTPVNLSFKVVGVGPTEKPPIFLLHPLLGSKKNWKGIGKTLTSMTKRTAVVVDLRNHGSSPHINSNRYDEMAIDLLQLFDKLEVKRASIVGHDIGGRVAMCTSLMAPQRVAGLVIVDISPVSTSDDMKNMLDIIKALKALDLKSLKEVTKAQKVVRLKLKDLVRDDDLMNRITANIKIQLDGTIGWAFNIDSLLNQFDHFLTFPRSMKGKRYDGPVLFIGGQLSEYLPADDLTKIRDMFPNSVIRYIPKLDHNLHVQAPRYFLELTFAFLNTNY